MKIKKKQPFLLVCALADAPCCVPGSIFTHFCSCCGTRVMMAPTGQKLLAQKKSTRIVCYSCYKLTRRPGDTTELAGSREEIRWEVHSAQPDMRRYRN